MEDYDYELVDEADRFRIVLSREKTEELKYWLDKQRSDMESARSEFAQDQKELIENYDDFKNYVRKDGKWANCANLKQPLTAIMTKAYSTRFYNIFTSEDTVQFMPRESTDEKVASVYKKLRDWYLFDYINEFRGIKGVLSEVFSDAAETGFGFLFKNFVVKPSKKISLINKNKDEIFKEYAELEKEIKNTDNQKVSIKKYKEISEVYTHWKGSMLQSMPWDQVYFHNDMPEMNNVNSCEAIGLSIQLSESDLNLGVKQGKWSQTDIDEIISKTPQSNTFGTTDSQNYRQIKNEKSGILSDYSKLYNKSYDFEYWFCRFDIDDDGICEDLVIMRHKDGKILQLNLLYNVSRLNLRPLFKFDCFYKSRQGYSRGVPAILYSMQDEMDRNHNMRQDYLQLQTCPWGTYRSNSSLNNESIEIIPGRFIPVDENADLQVKNFANDAGNLIAEEDRLWQYSQWLLSVSPLNSGIVPETVGPLRSTSGVASILSQMEKAFKPLIEINGISWKLLEMSMIEDLDYRIDSELKKKIIGPKVEWVFSEADRIFKQEILAAKQEKRQPTITQADALESALTISKTTDIKIDVANAITTDAVRRNDALQILQMSINPSLLQQTGVVNPMHGYNAWVKWLRSMGILNVEDYAKKPMQFEEALDLNAEVEFIFEGQVPPMALADEHDKKAQGLQMFMQSEQYMTAKTIPGRCVPNVDQIMVASIEKHLRLFEMLQPKATALPNPSGETGEDQNTIQAGTSFNQGGASARTTSRASNGEQTKKQSGNSQNSEQPQNPVQ